VVGQLLSLLTLLKSKNSRLQPPLFRPLFLKTALKLRGPRFLPWLLVLFEHALGRLDGRDDNHGHRADQPGKK
jgi:hypothetical protein